MAMGRRAEPLTAARVKTAVPGASGKPLRLGDGGGLYLLVRSADAKFWLFRYALKGGKLREMGLGRAGFSKGEITLADARKTAEALMKTVRAGLDPLVERDRAERDARAAAQAEAARAKTFKMAAAAYMDAHEKALRNAKHRMQWRNTMATYVYPVFGEVQVGDVDTDLVLAVLDPIWATKAETAKRVRGRIEAVLDYAKSRRWRSGENPAAWRGHLAIILPSRRKVAPPKHHAALPWRDMADFWRRLGERPATSARALAFTILTAARSGETRGARWSEIDFEAETWTVPASRMKAGEEHRVPLNPPAIAILRAMAAVRIEGGDDGYIFPGASRGQPLSDAAMAALLKRMGHADLTVHGFRSSFRDWAGEATNHPCEVAEAALAHKTGNAVELAYKRGDFFDKRRALMVDWAGYCEGKAGASAANVHRLYDEVGDQPALAAAASAA